jgi:hypothetical protein
MTAAKQDAGSLNRVGRALSERTDELAAEMVRHIRAEVPAYARAESAVLERVLELSTATAQAINTALCQHQPVRHNDIPIVRQQAADRLNVGIELEAFLHAYRAALFFYWDAAMLEAGRLRLSQDATRAVGRFVLDSVDTITTHAAEAYLREDNRRATQTGRAVRDLIDTLIAGRARSGRTRELAAPGLDPTRPMQLILARITRSEHDLGTALTLVRDILTENLALGTTPPLSAVRQQEIVAIVAGSPPLSRVHAAVRCAREQCGTDISIGLSSSAAGFVGIPGAYQEAVLSLSYATSHRPVIALDDLPALQLLLLAATDGTRQLIRDKGSPLEALGDAERTTAVGTIRAFAAASMNITNAAATLHVHPNTVRYRLGQIAHITGLNPRIFEDLIDLICILEIRDEP